MKMLHSFALLLLGLTCAAACAGAAPRRTPARPSMVRLRGGSGAVFSASTASPLQSFIRQTSAATAAARQTPLDLATIAQEPPAPCDPMNYARRREGGAGVDDEGDSLMGRRPRRADVAAETADGGIPTSFAGAAGSQQSAVARGASAGGPDARSPHACRWPPATPVPFKYICGKLLSAAEADEGRLTSLLSDLLGEVWQHSPEDLQPLVCLLRDQILSPTLQGVELLPSSQLTKVVTDALVKTPEGLRESLAACDGDLAVTAQKLRTRQRTLFKPAPLALAAVVATLRDVAERSDMSLRIRGARSLLVAAGSEETLVLVRALQGTLRFMGFSKHVIITALAIASESRANNPRPLLPAPLGTADDEVPVALPQGSPGAPAASLAGSSSSSSSSQVAGQRPAAVAQLWQVRDRDVIRCMR